MKTTYSDRDEEFTIDPKTGQEVTPEKSEKDKFEDYLQTLSKLPADEFIDELIKRDIKKDEIIKYLCERYVSTDLAENLFTVCDAFSLLMKTSQVLNSQIIQLEEKLKQSFENFNELKDSIKNNH